MKRLLLPLALAVALAAGLALTWGDGDAQTRGAPLPDVRIARLADGKELALRDLASDRGPTLLWFWAPWCEVCNAEAPAIERFAADAGDELTVLAIGGRARTAAGPAFVARHRLRTPEVLFDEPMAAWEAYAIPGQPAGVLLDRDGRERQRWLGAFDTSEVLAAARAL